MFLVAQAQASSTALGLPERANSVAIGASAIAFNSEAVEFCYAFLRTDNLHLGQCRWDGQNSPLWADFGRPNRGRDWHARGANAGNVDIAGPPCAVVYAWNTGPRIYVFVVGADGHLHVCFWNGENWMQHRDKGKL
jgi:hypothetical protein